MSANRVSDQLVGRPVGALSGGGGVIKHNDIVLVVTIAPRLTQQEKRYSVSMHTAFDGGGGGGGGRISYLRKEKGTVHRRTMVAGQTQSLPNYHRSAKPPNPLSVYSHSNAG